MQFSDRGNNKSNVEAYNSSLTKTTATSDINGNVRSGSHNDNYAIFAGGEENYSTRTVKVTAYSNTLTKSTCTDLTQGARDIGSTSFNGYAIYGGGNGTGNVEIPYVQAYNNSLTKTNMSDLYHRSKHIGAGANKNYALLAGGVSETDSTTYDEINVYDTSLTKIVSSVTLSLARADICSATVGDYIVFVGGQGTNGQTVNTVDFFSKDLTRTTATVSQNIALCFTADTGDHAFFGGGGIATSGWSAVKTVFSYDNSLTSITHTNLSTARMEHACMNGGRLVGNKIVVAGGYTGSWGGINSVEAYVLEEV